MLTHAREWTLKLKSVKYKTCEVLYCLVVKMELQLFVLLTIYSWSYVSIHCTHFTYVSRTRSACL